MSRRGRSRRNDSHTPERVSPPRSLTPPLLRELASPTALRLVEDRRAHHPLQEFRPARQVSGHPVKPHVIKRSTNNHVLGRHLPIPLKVQFAEPKRTAICVRRGQRKEVLHALKKTGRGRGGGRKKRNWYSDVSC